MKKYTVDYLEPGYISKGSYVVKNENGKIIKSFARQNKAEEYCNILNNEE